MPQRNLVFPEGETTPVATHPRCGNLPHPGNCQLPLKAACPHAAHGKIPDASFQTFRCLKAACPHAAGHKIPVARYQFPAPPS